MKKYLLFLLLSTVIASAQENVVLDITSGENLNEKLSTDVKYVFPDFVEGQIHFKNGRRGINLLNYNMLVGEMQFMSNEEILAFSDLNNILAVVIDKRR